MTADTLDLFEWERNREDYTGVVCWAIINTKTRAYDTREALVNIEDFEELSHHRWTIQRIGKNRKLRVVRDGRTYLAREIMGFPPEKIVDHWNRNSLDDRRQNLRIVTVSENNLNREQSHRARSRFKGVAWLPTMNCWQVYSGKRKNRVLVGRFKNELDAARAYNEFAKKHYGPCAYLNPV